MEEETARFLSARDCFFRRDLGSDSAGGIEVLEPYSLRRLVVMADVTHELPLRVRKRSEDNAR
jgi:hypothetical protein